MSRFVMIAPSILTLLVFRSEIVEEYPDVFGQQFGFLQRGEMPTARHRSPSLYVKPALRPLAGCGKDVFRKPRYRRRDITSSCVLRRRKIVRCLVIKTIGGIDGFCHPIERDRGE